jgi:FKBP-type peptidyl-prolyl cis-trans isomerase SlpA
MNARREIVPGSAVTLHFSLSLPDGTEAISTFDDEPLHCHIGDRTFQPTMELALYGLKAGDEQTLTLTPEQAYGEPDPGLVQQMPLADFPEHLNPQADQVISFALPDGEETMGVVREVAQTHATVDFNHPLAGQEVVFRVRILEVGLPDPTTVDTDHD